MEQWQPPGTWQQGRHQRGRSTTPLIVTLVVALVVITGGGAAGAYWWWSSHGGLLPRPQAVPPEAPEPHSQLLTHGEGARIADTLLTPENGVRGTDLGLTDVAASGDTLVAVGTELGGNLDRGLFLVSLDADKSWHVAEVTTPAGANTAPAALPEHVVAVDGGWLAVSGSYGPGVWHSKDGTHWTAVDAREVSGIKPRDTVTSLARTEDGYVAIGFHNPNDIYGDDETAVIWTSADGKAWRRVGHEKMPAPPDGHVDALDDVAVHDGVILALEATTGGASRRRLLWRSGDGGRTWQQVTVRSSESSFLSPVQAIAATADGFRLLRRDYRSSDDPAAAEYVFSVSRSPDGRRWKRGGKLPADPAYERGVDLKSIGSRLVAVVEDANDDMHVLIRNQGRWAERAVLGRHDVWGLAVAMVGNTMITVGEAEGGIAILSTWPPSGKPVRTDLSTIEYAVHPEHRLQDVTVSDGLRVVVGSANGGPAVWTGRDGEKWRHATLSGGGGDQLTEAVHGDKGWLAVGSQFGVPFGNRPLVLVSDSGTSWRDMSLAKFNAKGEFDEFETMPLRTARTAT